MADLIPISEFELYLTDLLEKELQNAEETFEEVLHKRAMQLRGTLNTISPHATGNYSKGWRMRTATRNHEKVRVIYNVNRPELTYMLEYGTKHMKAQQHIRPALAQTIDEIMEELLARL